MNQKRPLKLTEADIDAVPSSPEVSSWPEAFTPPLSITESEAWRDGHGTVTFEGVDGRERPVSFCIHPVTHRVIWSRHFSDDDAVYVASGSEIMRDFLAALRAFAESADAGPHASDALKMLDAVTA